MKFTNFLISLLIISFGSSQQYNGGNDPQTLMNNPALIMKFLEQTTGKIQEACLQVPGIGYAVLSLKQIQQSINNLLNSENQDSFAKIIFFKEYENPKTQQLIFKTVLMFKTFTSNMYLGIEALYRNPSFEVLTYILDADLNTVRIIMDDESIDPNGVFACGDIKEIYSRKVFKSLVTVRVGEPDKSTLIQKIENLRSEGEGGDYYYGHPKDNLLNKSNREQRRLRNDRVEENQAPERTRLRSIIDREAKGMIN